MPNWLLLPLLILCAMIALILANFWKAYRERAVEGKPLRKINLGRARWRKASDINREFAIFELLDGGHLLGGETCLLSVGFSDEGGFEVVFQNFSGVPINWDQFRAVIEQGKQLAEADR